MTRFHHLKKSSPNLGQPLVREIVILHVHFLSQACRHRLSIKLSHNRRKEIQLANQFCLQQKLRQFPNDAKAKHANTPI